MVKHPSLEDLVKMDEKDVSQLPVGTWLRGTQMTHTFGGNWWIAYYLLIVALFLIKIQSGHLFLVHEKKSETNACLINMQIHYGRRIQFSGLEKIYPIIDGELPKGKKDVGSK